MTSGFRERSPAPDDLPAIAALVRLSERADMGVDLRSEAHIIAHTRADRFELARDAQLIVNTDGAAVGFAWLFETLPHAELEGELYVHPASRDRGLEARLLGWLEERAREHLPSAPSGRVSLALACLADDSTQRPLFERAGFVKVREFRHMELDLLAATEAQRPRSLPDGVRLRDFRSPDDAQPVYQALAEAFVEEFRYGEESYEAWRGYSVDRDDADTELWVVADHLDDVIGAVITFVEEGAGFVADVGVRPAWRRRGVASALLIEAFDRLRRRGCSRVWLNVDAENSTGAVAAYEGVGMRAVRRFDFFEKRYDARGEERDDDMRSTRDAWRAPE